jgi:predicted nucleic acid-binding protein
VTVKVVDASAVAAVAFLEPEQSIIEPRLAGHELHAPALLRFELAHVCQKKITRHLPSRDHLLQQLEASESMQIYLHEVHHRETVELATRLKLSIYDASYLWLARVLSAELVTLDGKLERAAKLA